MQRRYDDIQVGDVGLRFDGTFWYIGVYFGAELRIARRATVSDFRSLRVPLMRAARREAS